MLNRFEPMKCELVKKKLKKKQKKTNKDVRMMQTNYI